MDSRVAEETIDPQPDAVVVDGRAVEVYCWRVEQLERAGYSGVFAHMLADDNRVDLHLACDLLARGCPEQIAYSILS